MEKSIELSLADAIKVWNLLPEWVRLHKPGLDPTFYGTLSADGDAKVRDEVIKILGIDRIKVTHANASPDISEATICALRDVLTKAYAFEQKVSPPTLNIGMGESEVQAFVLDDLTDDSHVGLGPTHESALTIARAFMQRGMNAANAHTKAVTVEAIVKLAE